MYTKSEITLYIFFFYLSCFLWLWFTQFELVKNVFAQNYLPRVFISVNIHNGGISFSRCLGLSELLRTLNLKNTPWDIYAYQIVFDFRCLSQDISTPACTATWKAPSASWTRRVPRSFTGRQRKASRLSCTASPQRTSSSSPDPCSRLVGKYIYQNS